MTAIWLSGAPLQAQALDGLAELNEQCLELICEQAACSNGARPAFIAQLEALWTALDAQARRRAARCPFLLVELGFARGRVPTDLAGEGLRGEPWARQPGQPGAFFTVPRTLTVARLVLAYTWHLARMEEVASRLFLGLAPPWIERIAACTLRQVMQLAESQPGMLEPRWPDRVGVWRELLVAAASGEPSALEPVKIRGLQLLAAQVRADRAGSGRAGAGWA
ncbi:MAG: hypothetical protein ACREU3_09070 [Steroidobacteraceae bacterium]